MSEPNLWMRFPRELPAPFVVEAATRLERDGLDQLWVIEDCFYTSAPSLAATALGLTEDRTEAHQLMTPFLAGLLALPNPTLDARPHIEEIRELHADGGDDALATMPADWWLELGATGTIDGVVRHARDLHDAGADDVAFFPGPTIELTREDLDAVAAVRAAIA